MFSNVIYELPKDRTAALVAWINEVQAFQFGMSSPSPSNVVSQTNQTTGGVVKASGALNASAGTEGAGSLAALNAGGRVDQVVVTGIGLSPLKGPMPNSGGVTNAAYYPGSSDANAVPVNAVVGANAVLGAINKCGTTPACMAAVRGATAAAQKAWQEAVKIHGSSLSSMRKTTVYQLQNAKGDILKYGITSLSNPLARYSASFYAVNNARMIYLAQYPSRSIARADEFSRCGIPLCRVFLSPQAVTLAASKTPNS